MSVFLFHGSDDVLVSEAVSDKVRELVGDQDRSLMLEEFDGEYDIEELRLMRIKFISEVAN